MPRDAAQIALELLVLRCQDGERSAWRELIDTWHPRLRLHARRLLERSDLADDAVQEAWIAITRGLARLDDPAAFRAWAFRIVSHKCADVIRCSRRNRSLVSAAASMNPTPMTIDPALQADRMSDEERLQHAMRRLPPELHATVAMHYGEGMSIAEIAHALDIPPGTVKSRLHTARARLAGAIDQQDPKGQEHERSHE